MREGRLQSSTQHNSHQRSRCSTAIHHVSAFLFVHPSFFRHPLAASRHHTGSSNLPNGCRQKFRDRTILPPSCRPTIRITMLTIRPVMRIGQPTDGYLGVHLYGPAHERADNQRRINLVCLLSNTYAHLDAAVNAVLITLFQDRQKSKCRFVIDTG